MRNFLLTFLSWGFFLVLLWGLFSAGEVRGSDGIAGGGIYRGCHEERYQTYFFIPSPEYFGFGDSTQIFFLTEYITLWYKNPQINNLAGQNAKN